MPLRDCKYQNIEHDQPEIKEKQKGASSILGLKMEYGPSFFYDPAVGTFTIPALASSDPMP
jgi:hypothetical protein